MKSIITNEDDYISHGPVIGKIMNQVQRAMKKRLKSHRMRLYRLKRSQEDIANIDIVTWAALVKAGAYQIGQNVGTGKYLRGDGFDLRRGEAEAYLRRVMMQGYHKGLDEGMIFAEQLHQERGPIDPPQP